MNCFNLFLMLKQRWRKVQYKTDIVRFFIFFEILYLYYLLIIFSRLGDKKTFILTKLFGGKKCFNIWWLLRPLYRNFCTSYGVFFGVKYFFSQFSHLFANLGDDWEFSKFNKTFFLPLYLLKIVSSVLWDIFYPIKTF